MCKYYTILCSLSLTVALGSPRDCTCLGTVTAVDLTGLLALQQVIFRQPRVDILVTASNGGLPCAKQSTTDLACIVSVVLYSKCVGQELSPQGLGI